MTRDIVDYYANLYSEDHRLHEGLGRFEYERTKDILSRYLHPDRSVILDIGGGPGAYALWLAAQGYRVHLLDLVIRHVAIAKAQARVHGLRLASHTVGDATSLPFKDAYADALLLMGPLYHLPERAARRRALRESRRVLKSGGRIFCAAISRYASVLDGFRVKLFDDPRFEQIVERDLTEGQHRNIAPDQDYFTTAFFHKPNELRDEIEEAGLICDKVLGVEGPVVLMPALNEWIDTGEAYYRLALKYMQRLEEEESLLGASSHLLAIGCKP
jgi:ubiquinone/menaquinone biosynthesis C-methylase UbiE